MIEELKKYIEELKTIEMKKDDKPIFLSIEPYLCTLNNGNIIPREKILKNNTDGSAAIIFPITKDNKVILSVEPRVFTERTVDVGFPAGYIEEKEEPIISAKRELLEETGYSSDELIFLGKFYQDQGCSSALNHYFIAMNCIKISDQNLDEGEYIKYIVVTLEELDFLIENNYMTGLNSAFLYEKGKQYLRR